MDDKAIRLQVRIDHDWETLEVDGGSMGFYELPVCSRCGIARSDTGTLFLRSAGRVGGYPPKECFHDCFKTQMFISGFERTQQLLKLRRKMLDIFAWGVIAIGIVGLFGFFGFAGYNLWASRNAIVPIPFEVWARGLGIGIGLCLFYGLFIWALHWTKR